MLIQIKVVTNATNPRVVKTGEIFKVYVSASPEKGKANKAVTKMLADYFGVRPSTVRIRRGLKVE